jgi:hypothetical protein
MKHKRAKTQRGKPLSVEGSQSAAALTGECSWAENDLDLGKQLQHHVVNAVGGISGVGCDGTAVAMLVCSILVPQVLHNMRAQWWLRM